MLVALGEHLSNAQIARRLNISVRTVESHVASLMRKLDAPDRRTLAGFCGRVPGMFEGLPRSRTSFVGRSRECDAVLSAIDESRLVTLLGAGGMGKTRLAAVVAEAATAVFPAGGAFVDLVPVRSGFVLQAVSGALRVVARPQQTLEQAVLERLRPGRALLVLDNCEQLIDEVSGFVELVLSVCPKTTILATSRERLGMPGERVYRLPPLPLASDAERLFVERLHAVDPESAVDPLVVSTLCARLDGMPLAIELAAARSVSLGTEGVLAAVNDRLRLLSGGRGPDARHRSLRAVIGWSYDLLDAEERAMFRRMSIFVGGFDLQEAMAVNPEARQGEVADLLGRLVDKSLLTRRRCCWRMFDTVRAFGEEQLVKEGEAGELRHLHLGWAVTVAVALESGLAGSWKRHFDAVADDLRTALASTASEPDEQAHRLARSLARLTFARGFFMEARSHYRSAASRATAMVDVLDDLRRAASAAVAFSDGPDALSLWRESLELVHGVDDVNVRAETCARAVIFGHRFCGFDSRTSPEFSLAGLDGADAPRAVALLAAARAWEAGREFIAPDVDLARRAVAAAEVTGDPLLVVGALDALSSAYVGKGRLREGYLIARDRVARLEGVARDHPEAAAETIDAFYTAAHLAVGTGELADALMLSRGLHGGEEAGGHPYAGSHDILALSLSGRFEETAELADGLWDDWCRDGAPGKDWMSPLASAAALAHGLRGTGQQDLWRSRALMIARVEDPAESLCLAAFAAFADARLALHHGRLGEAAELVARARSAFSPRFFESYAHAAAAELAVVARLTDAGEVVAQATRSASENAWAAACLARTRGRQSGDPEEFKDAMDRFERIGARFEAAYTADLLDASSPAG